MLAGGLTLAGGVMTVMTAGAALPVLVAVGLLDDVQWIYIDLYCDDESIQTLNFKYVCCCKLINY